MAGVSSLVFRDIPERGMLTAVTYGLSLASHSDWKLGRPELMLTVESEDPLWGESIAYLANRLRGDCPFSYGNTIDFQGEIHPDSEMGAFLIFAPAAARKEDYANLDIGLKYKIHVAGVYPIHTAEIKLIQDWGLERFWKHPLFNMWNPGRPSLG